jgi:hypothetical protein
MSNDPVTMSLDTFLTNEKESYVIVIIYCMRDVHCYDVNESYLV